MISYPCTEPKITTNTEFEIAMPGKVVLDVGGRKFITLASTLSESQFLSALVSGRWDHNQQNDGSFFIDADPDLFQYVLEYLRRHLMPLCWDREKGHDLTRYTALLHEAEYYGIPKLSRWLKEQKYLDAVTITIKVTQRPIPDNEQITFEGLKFTRRQDIKTEWQQEDVYACPRNSKHTAPQMCMYHYSNTLCGQNIEGYPTRKQLVLRAIVVDEVVTIHSDVFRPTP